jgi:predicted nucleic acid-binding protein
MHKVLLDTDILSEFLKGHDKNVAHFGRLYAQDFDQFTFTSVTVYEIVLGLEIKSAVSQLERAKAWLRLNEQLVPTEDDYLTAAHIKARARRQGKVVELPDSLIAAVASRLQLPLVTGNTEDFQSIQQTGLNLTLENWRDP